MDFMGIGPLEVLLILILAFLLFGPEKLPDMAARAGQIYRNFRKTTFDLGKTISEELTSATGDEETKSASISSRAGKKADQLFRDFKEATSDLSKEITEELSAGTKAGKGSRTTSVTGLETKPKRRSDSKDNRTTRARRKTK